MPTVEKMYYYSIPQILRVLAAIDNHDKDLAVEFLGELHDEDVVRLDEDALRLVEKCYTERSRRGI